MTTCKIYHIIILIVELFLSTSTHLFFVCQDLRVTESLRYSPVWQTRSAFDVGRPKKNIRWWMDQVDGCWWLRHVETCNIFPRKINLTERVDETPKPEEWRFEFYFDVRHGLGIRIYQPRAHQKSFCEKKGNSIFFRSFLCFKQMTGMQVEAVV